MNTHIRQTTLTWILLISLTLISVSLGQTLNQPGWLAISIMLTVIVKGQQIIDVFMGLSNAPKGWRLLLLSYAVFIPMTTCIVSCVF